MAGFGNFWREVLQYLIIVPIFEEYSVIDTRTRFTRKHDEDKRQRSTGNALSCMKLEGNRLFSAG